MDQSTYTKLNISYGTVTQLPDPWLNVTVERNVLQVGLSIESLPKEWIDRFWEVRVTYDAENFVIHELELLIHEWLRVLKPGGVLCLMLPDVTVNARVVIDHLNKTNKFDTVKQVANQKGSAALHTLHKHSQYSPSMSITGKKSGLEDEIEIHEQQEFQLRNVSNIAGESNVSAVLALVFNEFDQILIIRNQRGWDIPGGHVENGESPEETLHREIYEEAYATVDNLQLFMSASAKSTMLFYIADVKELLPLEAKNETDRREFMHFNELICLYGGGKPELLSHVITAATKLRHCSGNDL